MDDTHTRKSDWRQGKWLIIAELIVVALIFLADERRLIPFSKTPFPLRFRMDKPPLTRGKLAVHRTHALQELENHDYAWYRDWDGP
jgi:hypothetical protein